MIAERAVNYVALEVVNSIEDCLDKFVTYAYVCS